MCVTAVTTGPLMRLADYAQTWIPYVPYLSVGIKKILIEDATVEFVAHDALGPYWTDALEALCEFRWDFRHHAIFLMQNG